MGKGNKSVIILAFDHNFITKLFSKICSMQLSPTDLAKSFIKLELRNCVYSGNMNLAQYFVR